MQNIRLHVQTHDLRIFSKSKIKFHPEIDVGSFYGYNVRLSVKLVCIAYASGGYIPVGFFWPPRFMTPA
jgi:hypothetical protein